MIQKNGKLIRLDEVRYSIVRLVYLIEVDILICTFYKNSYYYILFNRITKSQHEFIGSHKVSRLQHLIKLNLKPSMRRFKILKYYTTN